MCMVSAAVLLSLRTVRQAPGMRLFAAGMLSVCIGAIAGMSRLVITGAWIVIACQALMVGGLIAIVQGLRAFRGVAGLSERMTGGIIGAAGVAFLYLLIADNNFSARVVLISCINCALCVDATGTLLRRTRGEKRGTYWPAAAAFGTAALNYAARAVVTVSGHYGRSYLTDNPFDVAFTICASAAYIAGAFGILVAANERARADSARMALFDPLTNLPNRRHLFDRFAAVDDHPETTPSPAGLIYLDLDGFKEVNDFLGHAAGDELLLKISRAMSGALRSEDCLARIGGDEFVALIGRPVTRTELEAVAERLQSAVENQTVCDGLPWRIRVSCGTALYPDDGASMHEVMREADAAMYAVKRERRLSAALAS